MSNVNFVAKKKFYDSNESLFLFSEIFYTLYFFLNRLFSFFKNDIYYFIVKFLFLYINIKIKINFNLVFVQFLCNYMYSLKILKVIYNLTITIDKCLNLIWYLIFFIITKKKYSKLRSSNENVCKIFRLSFHLWKNKKCVNKKWFIVK